MAMTQNPITEFYTILHSKGLVALPGLGVWYFTGGDDKIIGYSVKTKLSNSIYHKISDVIAEGGDFSLHVMPNDVMHIAICKKNEDFEFMTMIEWELSWNQLITSLIKIQKSFRSMLFTANRRCKLFSFIAIFRESDRVKKLPLEIFKKIVFFYIESEFPTTNFPKSRKPNLKRMETSSFKETRRVYESENYEVHYASDGGDSLTGDASNIDFSYLSAFL
jgi:hypothetical protein